MGINLSPASIRLRDFFSYYHHLTAIITNDNRSFVVQAICHTAGTPHGNRTCAVPFHLTCVSAQMGVRFYSEFGVIFGQFSGQFLTCFFHRFTPVPSHNSHTVSIVIWHGNTPSCRAMPCKSSPDWYGPIYPWVLFKTNGHCAHGFAVDLFIVVVPFGFKFSLNWATI